MPFDPARPSVSTTYAQRVAFITEIASRLHSYGTTAQRLEIAIVALSRQLGLDCAPWSNPTGVILSFSDPKQAIGTSDITRVIRLAPGKVDLHKLRVADYVVDRVAVGRMSITQGHTILRRLDRAVYPWEDIRHMIASAMAVAGVAGLWKLPWLDLGTASIIGLLIGILGHYAQRHVATLEASEALAALLSSVVACLVATFIGPLNLDSVIIASLVVLLPGMELTNAVNELTSQHWVSGTARLAGALIIIMKLVVGAMIALTLTQRLGLHPRVQLSTPMPTWVEWPSLILAAYGFAVLLKANRHDYIWVMAAAIFSYIISRATAATWGSVAGIFFSGMIVTALGNLFGRVMQKPGALIRVPGFILLVPGSSSVRGLLEMIQQQSVGVGQSALLLVMNSATALVAGLLFGNLVIPPRKFL